MSCTPSTCRCALSARPNAGRAYRGPGGPGRQGWGRATRSAVIRLPAPTMTEPVGDAADATVLTIDGAGNPIGRAGLGADRDELNVDDLDALRT